MARDANGEVWVERGGQLTALSPHRKIWFDAMWLTVNHVVVGLASSDEQERVEHGRVAKIEFDPGPYQRARRWPTSESCYAAMPQDEREPRARLDRTTSASRPWGARAPGGPRAGPARPRGGTDQELAGAVVNCESYARSADRKPLSGDASSLPPRGALIALWIQALSASATLKTLVRPPLTLGVHGHSLACGLNASDRRT
jgi:hypothetical protein